MGAFLSTLLRVALVQVAAMIAALLGPQIRAFQLLPAQVDIVLFNAGALLRANAVTYVALGAMTPAEHEKLVVNFVAALKAVTAAYSITLTDVQIGGLLEEIGNQLST